MQRFTFVVALLIAITALGSVIADDGCGQTQSLDIACTVRSDSLPRTRARVWGESQQVLERKDIRRSEVAQNCPIPPRCQTDEHTCRIRLGPNGCVTWDCCPNH
jgi:hypothetical protein